MAFGEMIVAFGRVVATEVVGKVSEVVASLRMFEGSWDDEGAEGSEGEPLWGALGFYGRPAAPVEPGRGTGSAPEGHASFVGLRVGDRVVPVAYSDPRLSAKVNPKEGEIVVVQYRGGFLSLRDNDSGDGTSIVLYAVRNAANGNPEAASVLSIDTTKGASSISLTHEKGQTIGFVEAKRAIVISNKAGDSYIEINDDGITLNGNIVLSGSCSIGDKNPASSVFLAKGPVIDADAAALRAAISGWTPVSNDGGAALKTALTSWLAAALVSSTTLTKGV